MAYSPVHPLVGHGPVDQLFVPSTTALHPQGMILDAYDPYWGQGRFIYLKSAAAQVVGNIVMWKEDFVATVVPSTANQGFPVAVAHQTIASGAWGWYMLSGFTPIKVSASVATDVAIGIGTSAGLGGTYATGKGLTGIQVLQAATYAVTAQGLTKKGSKEIRLNKLDGFFVGGALTGTGVAAGTVATMNPLAVISTADSTASATVTVTCTYTGFVLANINHPSCTMVTA